MTTKHLWLVIDRRTGPGRVQPRIVACSVDEYAPDVAQIPTEYAQTVYMRSWDGGAIWPVTGTEVALETLQQPSCDEIWQEQEREQRRKRGVE